MSDGCDEPYISCDHNVVNRVENDDNSREINDIKTLLICSWILVLCCMVISCPRISVHLVQNIRNINSDFTIFTAYTYQHLWHMTLSLITHYYLSIPISLTMLSLITHRHLSIPISLTLSCPDRVTLGWLLGYKHDTLFILNCEILASVYLHLLWHLKTEQSFTFNNLEQEQLFKIFLLIFKLCSSWQV